MTGKTIKFRDLPRHERKALIEALEEDAEAMSLCSDCPPAAYPTEKTRCDPCPRRPTKWKIRIAGYGTFDFEGTEAEAEEMRKHKSRWEQGVGIKWRADLARESDHLTAEIASLWDAGKGAPSDLFDKRREALKVEASDV